MRFITVFSLLVLALAIASGTIKPSTYLAHLEQIYYSTYALATSFITDSLNTVMTMLKANTSPDKFAFYEHHAKTIYRSMQMMVSHLLTNVKPFTSRVLQNTQLMLQKTIDMIES